MSLTSHPARFQTVGLTLRCLLAQSVRPDAIQLWIAHQDLESLPVRVRRLSRFGVIISGCEDLKSFTKLVPAIKERAGQFIVTCDDDLFYGRHWLRRLVLEHRPASNEIVCHRAHRIRFGPDGLPVSYSKWEHDVAADADTHYLFPTTGHGVLYELDAFHADVTRADLFRALCPTADDAWFYWMVRMQGFRIRKVGPRFQLLAWRGTQRSSLYAVNVLAGSGNDDAIRALTAYYGMPE